MSFQMRTQEQLAAAGQLSPNDHMPIHCRAKQKQQKESQSQGQIYNGRVRRLSNKPDDSHNASQRTANMCNGLQKNRPSSAGQVVLVN